MLAVADARNTGRPAGRAKPTEVPIAGEPSRPLAGNRPGAALAANCRPGSGATKRGNGSDADSQAPGMVAIAPHKAPLLPGPVMIPPCGTGSMPLAFAYNGGIAF